MNWHYVYQGQQAGPVSEEEILALVRERKIPEDTLVWRDGIPNWTPFHEAGIPSFPPVAPATPPIQRAIPANPNETVCAECGRIFPLNETISHGNLRVCAACKPVFLQKLAEGAKINTGELNCAGFGIRLGAKALDGIIVGVPFIIMIVVLTALAAAFDKGSQREASDISAMFLGLFILFGGPILYLGYQIYFVGKHQATPGKMACRLKVVSANGARINYSYATARAFAEWLSAVIFYIGYLMVLFDSKEKRALHDHICSTRVVHS